MKNLEQIRAANALKAAENSEYNFTGKNTGEVVKKTPAMIMENGILAAAAFARDSRGGHEHVFHALIAHLKSVGVMPRNEPKIIDWLTKENSATLRAATSESLAYLNFLRRFVKREE